MEECRRNWSLKLHGLMGYRMIKTKDIGMKAQSPTGIVAIAIFHVATNRMPHISTVDTDLVFSACLQTELYEAMTHRASKYMVVGDCVFSSIVFGT